MLRPVRTKLHDPDRPTVCLICSYQSRYDMMTEFLRGMILLQQRVPSVHVVLHARNLELLTSEHLGLIAQLKNADVGGPISHADAVYLHGHVCDFGVRGVWVDRDKSEERRVGK